jgi:hypothetical protein
MSIHLQEDDTDIYEVYFDTKYLNWVLTKVVIKF